MMKTLHKLLKFAAFVICCIWVVTVQAQDGFTGDGFGGRSWYQPANIVAGQNVQGAVVKGQLYLWGYGYSSATSGSNDPFILPIPAANVVNDNGNVSTPVGTTPTGFAIKPYAAPGFSNTKMVSISVTASAIKTDGSGWVWGPTGTGYPWIAPSISSTIFGKTPLQVIPAGEAYFTHAGLSHAAFVKKDGTVWCVGWNLNGCFGTGVIGDAAPAAVVTTRNAYTATPVQMSNMTNAKRVFCFGYVTPGPSDPSHTGTLVLKGDGTVWVAGATNLLQSGGTDYLPHQVPGLTNVVDIKGGASFAVALTASGEVYAWGNSASTLGNGDVPFPDPAKIYFTPQKVLFPAGTPPIVAIKVSPIASHSYAIDEAGSLWEWGTATDWHKSGVDNKYHAQTPIFSAAYVADVTDGGDLAVAYLTRNNNYPSNQKLWFIGSGDGVGASHKISALAPNWYKPYTLNNPDTGYYSAITNVTWAPSNPSFAGLPDGIGTFGGDGTINCAKTQLTPAPLQGTASNIVLAVSLNVTTTGTFTPVISGSGMSLANSNYTITATKIGTQTFYIPLSYDGTALSTINFKFSEIATGCTITVSGSKPAIVNIITNDCVPTAGPALK